MADSEVETVEVETQEVIDPKAHQAALDELARYKAKHTEAEKHLKEKEKLARATAEEAALKAGDWQTLEKSYKEREAMREAEIQSERESDRQIIADMTSGQAASKLANDLALPGSADALLPYIKNRLKTEIHEGKPIIRVLDLEGKPSALSVEDLRKEIENNKAFAPLLIGSQATGGGHISKGGDGGFVTITRATFDALDSGAKMEHIKNGGKLTNK